MGTFVINLIESVIIVVVILMLAMGFKSGIIIGISLIVTVFGSFLFLGPTGVGKTELSKRLPKRCSVMKTP